jgi:peptidyl-prolyl cis-trans isomerase SurA
LIVVSLTAAVCLGAPSTALASITERVVAVVGEQSILWSEVLRRAAPARLQIRSALLQRYGSIDPNLLTVQEQELYKEVLDRIIDDRLEEKQAERARLTVTSEEIDKGLETIAARAETQLGRRVSVEDVLAQVAQSGSSEQDFREEIRRQIIEGKLIELRVRPRVRITEQDIHAAYARWVDEWRRAQPSATAPTLEDVRDAMAQRALDESLARAREQWLGELRRSAYVEVRL